MPENDEAPNIYLNVRGLVGDNAAGAQIYDFVQTYNTGRIFGVITNKNLVYISWPETNKT